MLGNLALGVILVRLWTLGVNAALIIGLYLVCTGFLRFVEEGYRGEVQTRKYFGLAIYQWLSILFIVFGSFIMTFELDTTATVWPVSYSIFAWALLGGLIGGFVGSVDLPKLHKPFCKLER